MKSSHTKFSLPVAFLLAGVVSVVATVPAHAAVGTERGPVTRVRTEVPSTAVEARVIVKYRAASALMRALSVAGTPAGEAKAGSASAAPPQQAATLSRRLGLALADGRPIGASAQVLMAHGMSSQDLANRLAAQPDVEFAVVDGRKFAFAAVPNDPLYPGGVAATTPAVGQWYLRAPNSTTIVDQTSTVSAINAESAWAIATGSASTVVAVLDTGVRFDHPDLAPKLLSGYDFISETAVSVDGDARDSDASDPGDSFTAAEANQQGNNCFHMGPKDSSGAYVGASSSWHGTQTAGLIGAATNNGGGMASSGRDVRLLPVRVLGKCGGYDSDIQAAMLWAGGLSATPVANPNPAKVINLSLGGSGACDAMYTSVVQQLTAAGVVVVAAAGNEGLAVGTPANCLGVIAVAGVREVGTKVGYSDLGPEVAIAAPAGNCVNGTGTCLYPLLTTSNSGTTTPVAGAAGAIYTSGGANASLGTSFSAPLVSGTVGLMLSANPSLTPGEVRAALQGTARPFPASGSPPVQLTSGGPLTPVTACVAPTASPTAQSSECYCTTSTCGAGLLDAGAAVAAVAVTTANIDVASTATPVNGAVMLNGSASRGSLASGQGSTPPPAPANIASYQWAIAEDSAGTTFTSATNASSATVLPTTNGNVTVSLTVTDTLGRQATTSTILTAGNPAPAVPPSTPPAPPPPANNGGGGGGAVNPGWLLALLAAIAGTWVVTPGRSRRRSR